NASAMSGLMASVTARISSGLRSVGVASGLGTGSEEMRRRAPLEVARCCAADLVDASAGRALPSCGSYVQEKIIAPALWYLQRLESGLRGLHVSPRRRRDRLALSAHRMDDALLRHDAKPPKHRAVGLPFKGVV